MPSYFSSYVHPGLWKASPTRVASIGRTRNGMICLTLLARRGVELQRSLVALRFASRSSLCLRPESRLSRRVAGSGFFDVSGVVSGYLGEQAIAYDRVRTCF